MNKKEKMNQLKEIPTIKINKTNISNLIDQIHLKFSRLFDDLVLIKNFNSKKFNGKIIIEFQYKLGKCLFELSTVRNEVIKQKKIIISKINKYNSRWFTNKMRQFKKLENALANCIDIGKSLGDVFAWHFYQLNLPELFKNFEYDQIKMFPTGVGGIGELKFIEKKIFLNHHIALFHSLTNILRIGDVSFMNLKDLKLTSIGEIKTMENGITGVDVSVTALNLFQRDFSNQETDKITSVDTNDLVKDYFDPSRFKRQLERTSSYIKKCRDVNKKDSKLLHDTYYVKEFEDVVASLGKKSFNIKRVGSDLLYVAIPMSTNKFSNRMYAVDNIKKISKYQAFIKKEILSILKKDEPNYNIQTGSIHFNDKLEINHLIGTSPLFWYPIKHAILKEIYFQNVLVLTLFNPTNFYSQLKKIGVEIIKDEKTDKQFIGKKLEVGYLKIESFNYFLTLILSYLHTPEAVIKVIKELISQTEKHKDLNKNIKTEAEIIHVFSDYNIDNID